MARKNLDLRANGYPAKILAAYPVTNHFAAYRPNNHAAKWRESLLEGEEHDEYESPNFLLQEN